MSVGVVVIGRNEGGRLRAAIESALRQADDVVYVDSGSSDGSAELARSLGARVIVLAGGPFTAARGRDAGTQDLLARRPDLSFIQYMDGDCVLQAGWIDRALSVIEADPAVGAVFGRRREEKKGNVYSALADIDWDGTAGPADFFGGDALVRVRALKEAGGWAAAMIAGEDPDLSFRMRDAGWVIRRARFDSTLHDIRIHRFHQYWARAVRSGHAYAEVGARRWRGSGRSWLKTTAGIVVYGAALPLALAGSMFLPSPAFAWAIAAIVLVYLRLLLVLFRYSRRLGRPVGLSLIYAGLNVACKPAAAWGVFTFLAMAALGRRRGLIEYHDAVPLP